MEPNRGNSPACRKTQKRNISRNIYLLVCPKYGRHNKARRNYPYKEPTIHIRMKCELEDMDGIIGTMTANEAQIEGTGEKVNLFDYHVKADTILFQYATPDGRNEVVKFPLAGFCKNYLMQFVT